MKEFGKWLIGARVVPLGGHPALALVVRRILPAVLWGGLALLVDHGWLDAQLGEQLRLVLFGL